MNWRSISFGIGEVGYDAVAQRPDRLYALGCAPKHLFGLLTDVEQRAHTVAMRMATTVGIPAGALASETTSEHLSSRV
jgi:hypothetical protein